MANNEILQIVVFSMFFGVALAALGEIGKPLTRVIDSLAHVMLKITGYVMLLAPVAVFAAIERTRQAVSFHLPISFRKERASLSGSPAQSHHGGSLPTQSCPLRDCCIALSMPSRL